MRTASPRRFSRVPTIYGLNNNKVNKKKSIENFHFSHFKKSLHIAWACFRNANYFLAINTAAPLIFPLLKLKAVSHFVRNTKTSMQKKYLHLYKRLFYKRKYHVNTKSKQLYSEFLYRIFLDTSNKWAFDGF